MPSSKEETYPKHTGDNRAPASWAITASSRKQWLLVMAQCAKLPTTPGRKIAWVSCVLALKKLILPQITLNFMPSSN